MTKPVCRGFGEDVGGGDGVLNGEVDADAADGGHGVGGVADAEEAGEMPAVEAIDLDAEKLDLIPAVISSTRSARKGRCAAMRWRKASRPAGLISVVEGVFGDDEGALTVVGAIDEDDEAAVVDVAEEVGGSLGVC